MRNSCITTRLKDSNLVFCFNIHHAELYVFWVFFKEKLIEMALFTVLFQVPKIAVPLNTTKYNPTLDDNLTLISSFNKFPYPTQAELSWLTAASKHPEEQIKVWFTTQRLKQGISWSPEEVGIIISKALFQFPGVRLRVFYQVFKMQKQN